MIRRSFFLSMAAVCSPLRHRCFSSRISSIARQEIFEAVNEFKVNIPVESCSTPPSSWYTNALFHQFDHSAIFKKNPVAVNSVAILPSEPHAFLTGKFGAEPYLIVQSGSADQQVQNGLRAFYNICRHHATTLVHEECGSKQLFECPYHGWTYDYSGRLVKATKLKGIKDFTARQYGLRPIGCSTWGPSIFLSFDDPADRIPSSLSERLDETLLSLIRYQDMKFVGSREFVNGLLVVFVDNYLDGGYHVSYAHPKLASRLELNDYMTDVSENGRYAVQTSRGRSGDKRVGSDDQATRVAYAFVYPNVMYNRYGPWLDVNYVEPGDSIDQCRVLFHWFLQQSVVDEKHSEAELNELIDENLRESDLVQQEDIEICERVQAGLTSSGFDVGRYAPRLEHADYTFHQWLYTDYINALSSTS